LKTFDCPDSMNSLKKYINPKNYFNRGLSYLNKYVLDFVESKFVSSESARLKHPPIFFLGAPRSGSTLMIQVLTDAFDFGYISNRHCQFFGAPFLAERVFRPLRNNKQSDYISSQGRTFKPEEPAECGQWWYRFFRRKPAYVTIDEVTEKDMLNFRKSIALLTDALDRPVIFKNLYASLRIQAIATYIPEALFIITERDEIDNAHSLLETRKKVFDSYDIWWSMDPPDIEILKTRPNYEQVVEQIRSIHKTIQSDLQKFEVNSERVLRINYEEFCSDVYNSLNKLESFCKYHKLNITRKNQVPGFFPRRNTIKVDQDIYQKMKAYAQA